MLTPRRFTPLPISRTISLPTPQIPLLILHLPHTTNINLIPLSPRTLTIMPTLLPTTTTTLTLTILFTHHTLMKLTVTTPALPRGLIVQFPILIPTAQLLQGALLLPLLGPLLGARIVIVAIRGGSARTLPSRASVGTLAVVPAIGTELPRSFLLLS